MSHIPGIILNKHFAGTLKLSSLILSPILPFRGIEIPKKFANRSFSTPVKDQGNEGSCVGFGACSSFELITRIKYNPDPEHPEIKANDRSDRDCYQKAKTHDEWEGDDYEGSSITGGVLGMADEGICHERLWPYVAQNKGEPLPRAQEDAYIHKIKNYWQLVMRQELNHLRVIKNNPINPQNLKLPPLASEVLQQIKEAIFTKGCVDGGTLVHEGWRWVGTDGIIPFNPLYRILGGHAICYLGYDDDTKLFLFKNSWGADWGNAGYGYQCYDDVAAYLIEAFTLEI